MATFNFNGDTTTQGNQYLAGRDMFIGGNRDRAGVVEGLNELLSTTREAISSGALAPGPGDEATAEISAAIAALTQPGTDAPQRARISLARTRDILTTAALVPGLAEGSQRPSRPFAGCAD